MMTPDELRNSFLSFVEKRGGVRVPSSSLLPENDPTTLFTGSGMQPMIPYLLGEKHPSGTDIVNVQKCVRTGDIEEIGDTSHLTFFEMIGRWELGGDPATFKRHQIQIMWDWQIKELGIDPNRLYVSVFEGDAEIGIPRDDEAIEIWSELFRSVGIDPIVEDEAEAYGASRGGRIFVYNAKENWWSRSGVPANMPVGEPGGPDSEMFYDFEPEGDPKDHPATDTDRFLEIGNNVFMAFKRVESGFEPLTKPNIDYGGGLERVAAALAGDRDVYLTPFFTNPMKKLEELSGKAYSDDINSFRIVLDHARASVFLIGDGAEPSNVDAGYITRRLMRRAIRVARKLGITDMFMSKLASIYIEEAQAYPAIGEAKERILTAVNTEEERFHRTLESGEREMKKHLETKGKVTGEDAFYFYETFGFPFELTQEFLAENDLEMEHPEGFKELEKKHSELSRTAAAGKFKGGLADHSEKTTAFHSATHLLLAGLREVLGDHVHQKGSNITNERTRFDFNHPEKMTPEQKQAVEQYVNEAIATGAKMETVEMPKDQAQAEGVEGSFWEKYPDIVKVFVFEDESGKVWSKELCGGPHVEDLTKIAEYGRFKIKKEESSSAGVRRIKGIFVEN
jgi:alanyl-tRNA synthetase